MSAVLVCDECMGESMRGAGHTTPAKNCIGFNWTYMWVV